ncbi:MAG: TetR family transcriptional regulator [Pseudonocardiales bacterium]|nr:MAG: TetR family transcriptional regulator [Pseudonocardiales bacterium]
MTAIDLATNPQIDPRDRILGVAYAIFPQRGIRAVEIEELIAASGVPEATFYRHFPSKESLVLAYLERREQVWTLGFVVAGTQRRGTSPESELLAVFDVLDEWFQREDFEACSFVKVMMEMGPTHPLGRAAIQHIDNIRAHVCERAEQAGLREPDAFARSLMILIKGAILSATEGDGAAADRAQGMARDLIEHHRPSRSPVRASSPGVPPA